MSDVATLVRRFYDELWNAWDDEAVAEVLHPELRFRGSLGQETVGLDAWRGYRDGVRRGSPDFHNEVVHLVADGAQAAARLRWSGTHAGPLLGIAATGRTFTYDGAALFRARAGLLAEIWVVGDLDGLRAQLS
ncbi:MAG TPA: ester cyclase [Nocardioides sp.]|nr:ester cyclase [Nocardioides sp.]